MREQGGGQVTRDGRVDPYLPSVARAVQERKDLPPRLLRYPPVLDPVVLTTGGSVLPFVGLISRKDLGAQIWFPIKMGLPAGLASGIFRAVGMMEPSNHCRKARHLHVHRQKGNNHP